MTRLSIQERMMNVADGVAPPASKVCGNNYQIIFYSYLNCKLLVTLYLLVACNQLYLEKLLIIH